ncbi:NERD domain-containing protein [Halomonas denitrificans]|nr:NERD domain-containing protein [Halomonas denitrificans]
MIIKERDQHPTHTASERFGAKQEQDVAFYLRREYSDNPDVFVVNDLRFENQGEVTQIDHLLVYRHGFVLIESKSIYGEVRVNQSSEWSRSYKGKWQGMASPLQQLALQEKGLKRLLEQNKDQVLPKLFGLQQGFGARRYECICAVSSSALLHRDSMPSDISQNVIKSEFIADKVRAFTSVGAVQGFVKTLPTFSDGEMSSICEFLLTQHQSRQTEPAAPPAETSTADTAHSDTEMRCKQCGGADALSGAWGKYGYYVACSSCKVNTSMKGPCHACNSINTKISKSGPAYSRTCLDCSSTQVIFNR